MGPSGAGAFAAGLDPDVLAALGALELEGTFFGSVSNYNRLALLPDTVRCHRLQALAEFPALVAPLLLDVYGRPDMFGSRVAVGDDYTFTFNPQGYAPSRDYDGRFGVFDFRKHYYGRIGDFDSKEEFECTCKLDALALAGRIQFWVRNLVRKEGCSFFLQKADGRFYPDFLCKLNDRSILVVEYKGADRWDVAQDGRDIGDLWAALSGGRCKFVMVHQRQWETIEALL